MKVNPDELGKSRPKIEQGDIEDGDAVIVTIVKVEREMLDGDNGEKQPSIVLTTEEYGPKIHRLNKTQAEYIVDRLGNDTDDWIGQKVPLEKVTKEFGSKKHEKVWVMAPERWDQALGVKKPAKKSVVGKPKAKARKR